MNPQRWPVGVLIAAALASSACSGGEAAQPAPECSSLPKTLAPGELVEGEDPASLFAPYWGSFDATLSWVKGGETPFTLTVSPGTETDVRVTMICTKTGGVYTYPELRLTTQDGGLDETAIATLDVPLPGKSLDHSGGVLFPSVLSDWQWHGAVADHLPSDIGSYQDRGLLPVIDWEPGAPQPSSLLLYFYARLIGMTDNDQILVASVSFPEQKL